MGFRRRLALFVVTILVAVQAITAGTILYFTRTVLMRDGETSLQRSAASISQQLNNDSRRVAETIAGFAANSGVRGIYAKFASDMNGLKETLGNADYVRVQLSGSDGRVELDSGSMGGGASDQATPHLPLSGTSLARGRRFVQRCRDRARPQADLGGRCADLADQPGHVGDRGTPA